MRVRAVSGAVVTLLAAAGLALVSCSVPDGSGARPVDSDIAALLTPTVTPTPERTAQPKPTLVTWVKGENLVQISTGTGEDAPGPVGRRTSRAGRPRPDRRRAAARPRDEDPSWTVDRRHGARLACDARRAEQQSVRTRGSRVGVGQLATTALSIPKVRTVVFSIDGSRTEVSVPGAHKPQRVLTMRDYRKVLR